MTVNRSNAGLWISCFFKDNKFVFDNHARYCKKMGYRHRKIVLDGLQSDSHRILAKLLEILYELNNPSTGDFVCVATEDIIIINDMQIDLLMQGYNHTYFIADDECSPNTVTLQVWRNNDISRSAIASLISLSKVTRGVSSEISLFSSTEYLDRQHYPLVCLRTAVICRCNARTAPLWIDRKNIFALELHDIDLYAGTPDIFRSALANHVNVCRERGVSLLQSPDRHAVGLMHNACLSKLDHPIGIVMSYTENISSYGKIAEESVRAYCSRHGYSLHVHRGQSPKHPEVTGPWVKPLLLLEHFDSHEWVFWLDADILVTTTAAPLEPLLIERDLLLAHDIGPWIFNAGVMGFRCTLHNRQILLQCSEKINSIEDKSSTYASGGDQTVFNDILTSLGWSAEMCVDTVNINTPWFFPLDQAGMIHFYGIQPYYKTLLMAFAEQTFSGVDVTP